MCATCPVIINCREHALATHEPYGVWGGLTEEERRAQIARIMEVIIEHVEGLV